MAGADTITPDGRPMILHLGVQKTGTTSLQRFLRLNVASVISAITE